MLDDNKLLHRQLARLELEASSLPIDLEKWIQFLKVINQTYTELDQERQMLERSMQISSKELLDVNHSLKLARDSARQAGMSEVAIFVLHNVGNVLNSAKVSAALLKEEINSPYFQKLFSITNLIKEKLPTPIDYLTNDPKGKLIPQYLANLGDVIKNKQETICFELTNLFNSLNHVEEIIAVQQQISVPSDLISSLFLPELIDDAVQMISSSSDKRHIKINKKFDEIPFILTDKTKLLQILINIIKNAQDAVLMNSLTKHPQINIFLKKEKAEDTTENNIIKIIIEDNGIGITPENLKNIFSFGFTTKNDGHGFGLHSCILGAKELGGALIVESNGLNRGAKFTLTLPLEQLSISNASKNLI